MHLAMTLTRHAAVDSDDPTLRNLTRRWDGAVVLDGQHGGRGGSGTIGHTWPLYGGTAWVYVTEDDPETAFTAASEAAALTALLEVAVEADR